MEVTKFVIRFCLQKDRLLQLYINLPQGNSQLTIWWYVYRMVH